MQRRGWRSRRHTLTLGAAIARAAATPDTPPPIIATSTLAIGRGISYARHDTHCAARRDSKHRIHRALLDVSVESCRRVFGKGRRPARAEGDGPVADLIAQHPE